MGRLIERRRRHGPGLPGDGAVPFGAAMGGKVEHLVLSLAAGVEVAWGQHHLVTETARLRHDRAVGSEGYLVDKGLIPLPDAELLAVRQKATSLALLKL